MALADEEGGVGAALNSRRLGAGDIVILDGVRAGTGDDSGIEDDGEPGVTEPVFVRSIGEDPGIRVFRGRDEVRLYGTGRDSLVRLFHEGREEDERDFAGRSGSFDLILIVEGKAQSGCTDLQDDRADIFLLRKDPLILEHGTADTAPERCAGEDLLILRFRVHPGIQLFRGEGSFLLRGRGRNNNAGLSA